MLEDLANLPPAERAVRYRELADEAKRYAESAGFPKTREAYLLMAQQWIRLAEDLESRRAL
jgi:hypothetical protein